MKAGGNENSYYNAKFILKISNIQETQYGIMERIKQSSVQILLLNQSEPRL